MLNRLIDNWVYGGFLAGLLLLALAPLLIHGWPLTLAAAYFCLPVYMVHQYEEHDNDRFRRFVNRVVGGGRELLTPLAVFIINVPGVWGVIVLSLWLGARVNPGFTLIAVYLLLVNAVIHIAYGAITRRYNPGLASAILMFLPAGCWGLVAVQESGAGSLAMHSIGLAFAIATHLAIIVAALQNQRKYAAVSARIAV